MSKKINLFSSIFILTSIFSYQSFAKDYNLILLNGNDISMKNLTMTLDNGHISGKICNDYVGNIKIDNNNISFVTPMISTKMYCIDQDINQIEENFFNTIEKSTKILFEQDKIFLKNSDNQILIEAKEIK